MCTVSVCVSLCSYFSSVFVRVNPRGYERPRNFVKGLTTMAPSTRAGASTIFPSAGDDVMGVFVMAVVWGS